MNLRFHGPVPAAELRRGIDCLLRIESDGARLHGDTEFRQKLLRLILMNVHRRSPLGALSDTARPQ